jgi:hypothetical protein
VKKVFDRNTRGKSLQVGNLVLLWDERNEKVGDHNKFGILWLGPYLIDAIANPTHSILWAWMGRESR